MKSNIKCKRGKIGRGRYLLKLSKEETASIVVTAILILAVIAVSLYSGNSGASVTVTLKRAENDASETSGAAEENLPDAKDSPQTLININTASADELVLLPGIGEVLAERIVTYRNEYGLFASTDEIMRVSGIGSAKYEDIKKLITVLAVKETER
jgi:competence protein ComEA